MFDLIPLFSFQVAVRNVEFESSLLRCLGQRENSLDEIQTILYQMSESELNTVENDETLLHKYCRRESEDICTAHSDSIF